MGGGPPVGAAGELPVVTKWHSWEDLDIMQPSASLLTSY